MLIEFKMKSVESANQLSRYDAALARLLPGVPPERTRKILLTVAGTPPQSGDGRWLPRTYLALRHALTAITVPVRVQPYLDDYVVMLDRVCACLAAVDDPIVSFALMDKPSERHPDAAVEAMREYVTDMRIRHLFVRAWWEGVARRLVDSSPPGSPELRLQVDAGGAVQSGEGLLNVYLAELQAQNGSRFVHGLQVQGPSLKAFIEPYPRRELSDEDVAYANQLHAALARVRDGAPQRWSLGRAAPIRAGEQGHRSITLGRLSIGGRPFDLDGLEKQRDIATWAEVVKAALVAVRADIRPEAFPGFVSHPITAER